jgi:TolB-like protein
VSPSKSYFANFTCRLWSLFAVATLAGCSMLEAPFEVSLDTTDANYFELKQMLEQQRIEWETQKPALERLVKNEEDLAFLIDTLSQLSVIGTTPSLEQYSQGEPQFAKGKNQEMAVNDSVTNANTNTNTNANATNSVPGENLLAALADSPEELNSLMNELQKLVKTARYQALNPFKETLALPSTSQTYLDAGVFANSKVQLSDYAGQLASKLAEFRALEGARVGVASFVEFDQSLRTTSSLGNQFAEALATELPQYGVQVVDFKLTQYIDVSPRGDLALSRDMQDLTTQIDMKYVLTGTLVATNRGVKINSRVVSTQDNSVIAAASTFVPKALLQIIQP